MAKEVFVLATKGYDDRDARVAASLLQRAHKAEVVDAVVGYGIVVELHGKEYKKEPEKCNALPAIVE